MFLQLPFCRHCQSLESLICTVPSTNLEKNDADCGQEQERNTRPFLNFCEKCNCTSPSTTKVRIPPYTPCFLLAVPLQSVLHSASQSSVGTQTEEDCNNKNCYATEPVQVKPNDCIQEESQYPIFSGELLNRGEPNLLEFSLGFHSTLHDKNKKAKTQTSDGMPLSNDKELHNVYVSDNMLSSVSSSSCNSFMQEITTENEQLQEEDMSITIHNSRAMQQGSKGSEFNEGPSSNFTTDLDDALRYDSYEEYERIKTKGFSLASCLDYLAKQTYLYIDHRYEICDIGDGEKGNCDGKLDFILQHCIVQKDDDSDMNITRSYSVNFDDENISPLYTDNKSLHCKGDYYWHEDSLEHPNAYFCQDEDNTSPEQFTPVIAYDSGGYHTDYQVHAVSDDLNEAPEFYPFSQFPPDIPPRYGSKALHDEYNYFKFIRDTNSLSAEEVTGDIAINLEPNLSKEFESKSNDISL